MGLSIDLSTMEGLTRLITSVERHPVRTFVAIGLLFALLYTTTHVFFPRAHGRVINGDAIQQYVYLQSVAIDGDLDFGNEYQAFFGADDAAAGNVWLTTTTPVGRSPNMMPVGPALLWAPAFLLVWLVAWLTRLVGGGIPLDGLAAPFQISVGIAGIAYATAGVCLCHDLARRIYPATAAFWATLTLWLASSVVYYSLVSPAYSHAVSLFAVALFCHAWFRTRDRDGVGRFVLLGALGGLAALMRWQDAIVLILPGAELARDLFTGRRAVPDTLVRGLAVGVACGVMLVPQFVAWQAIYGHPLVMPQGGGFMAWTRPAVLEVLLSLRRGLFTWTPAVLLAVVGLSWVVRRDAVLGWAAVTILFLATYVNASVSDWWAGEAFGARRFISYTPFLVLGLTALFATPSFTEAPARVRVASVALIVYNLLFLFQYQLFMRGLEQVAPYPDTFQTFFVERLIVPVRLVRSWLGG